MNNDQLSPAPTPAGALRQVRTDLFRRISVAHYADAIRRLDIQFTNKTSGRGNRLPKSLLILNITAAFLIAAVPLAHGQGIGTNRGVVTPGRGAVAPSSGALVPGGRAAVPSSGAIVPGGGNVVPSTGALIPGGGNVVPSSGALVPGGATPVPSSGALVPGGQTVMPGSGILVPRGGTALPGRLVVAPGAGTPPGKANGNVPSAPAPAPVPAVVVTPPQTPLPPGSNRVIGAAVVRSGPSNNAFQYLQDNPYHTSTSNYYAPGTNGFAAPGTNNFYIPGTNGFGAFTNR